MITLYGAWQSTCSARVRLILHEKDIAYEEIDLDLMKGDQFDPEYVKLNPKAVVPTLIHDGKVLNESTLIMEYLDETFPEPAMKPDDPYKRLRMRGFAKWLDEEGHGHTNLVAFAAFQRMEIVEKNTPEELEARLAKLPDRAKAARQKDVLEHGLEAESFKIAVRGLDHMLEMIDDGLVEFGGPWIVGDVYSLAEAAVSSYVRRLELIGFEGMIAARPRVAEWYERVKARPNFPATVSLQTPDEQIESRRARGQAIWPAVRTVLAA